MQLALQQTSIFEKKHDRSNIVEQIKVDECSDDYYLEVAMRASMSDF